VPPAVPFKKKTTKAAATAARVRRFGL